ncbi:MAG: hypothetical protein HAW58_05150 [Candidatus Thioglobus sp.]|nr:hypothetical protein [Candidatus Thioglobus sp.]
MPWDTQNQPKTQTKTNDIRHSKMDDYYEGLANYYQQMENQNNYYGYKSKGYFDYMPGMGNNFPAK